MDDGPIKIISLSEFNSEEAARHLKEGRIVRLKGLNTDPRAIQIIHASLRDALLTHMKYEDYDSLRGHNYATSEHAYYDFYWIQTEINVKENEEAIHLLTEKDPFS